MSTFASTVFTDSDEEHDPDYVPEETSDSDEDTKKPEERPVPEPAELEAERATKEAVRASLWAEFQSSVGTTSNAPSSSVSKQVKLVKVQRKYRFAGEEVSEIVEVPEDSEDAKRWPLWKSSSSTTQAGNEYMATRATTHSGGTNGSTTVDRIRADSESSGLLSPSTPPAVDNDNTNQSSVLPISARSRPGPRKPKTTLAPLPSGKPKKLTTLEKSAMDWQAHVTQQDSSAETPSVVENLADELERNRRSGGYLEKVAFLERVGSRREEVFEESRKKRRKT